MTTDLVTWIAQRITDEELDDQVGLLILAALEGEESLSDYLDTGEARSTVADAAAEDTGGQEPVGAFLRSITVRGFRGIGEEGTLELDPRPGLTVVAGRNGSGKSSFAEALEVALTGTTYRWLNKAVQWRESWRNLHAGTPAEITVTVAEEGAGQTSIGVRWPDDANDVAGARRWLQRPGRKREDGTGGLGWTGALQTYRPLLSYDELGGMFEKGPSALYDALASVLGVEQLGDAIRMLDGRAKAIRAPEKELTARRRALQTEATGLDDPRAAQAAAALRKSDPDTAQLRGIASGGTVPDDGVLGWLRQAELLTAPPADDVLGAVERLSAAVEGMSRAGEAELSRQRAQVDLRERALHLHERYGEMSCPVCASATLDEEWARSSREYVTAERSRFRELELAHAELERRRTEARSLLTHRPATLNRSPIPELEEATSRARQAWDTWAQVPDSDGAVADHLLTAHGGLAAAVEALAHAAAEQSQARQDAWAPLAGRVAAFCEEWDAWSADRELADQLTTATTWLKKNDTGLKNERLEPIAAQARDAWARLRQESNVDLGQVTLEGTANRRHVKISASVDGQDSGALAVMSQGELHALSLALFLPRASLPESPFRFLVLDDPVQAMDPAKVDGLVGLLTELAKTRQVVVFSHDDRLATAVRRAGVPARILEVSRGIGSAVAVHTVSDPAERYLQDARALLKDADLPDATLRRVLPTVLRLAVEATARDRFFERRVIAGERIDDVERTWNDTRTTSARIALAVYDEPRTLDPWLHKHPHRSIGLGIVTSAAHEGLRDRDRPDDVVHNVGRLLDDVRTGVKA